MQLIIDTYENTKRLHHAYCIEGEKETILSTLYDFLEHSFDFSLVGNPDLWRRECETLSIDDSRAIKEFHLSKSFNVDGKKVFIIVADFITREAQNALLKIFEEPQPGNYFFLILPSADSLLPTLRSRLVIVESDSQRKKSPEAKRFLSAGISERLLIAKGLAESIGEDEKSKMDALSFVGDLEREYVGKRRPSDFTAHDVFVVEELAKVRDFLSDRSPSVKMLLEHVALIV